MNCAFTPLTELHFPLLLKWLGAQHVKTWWDQDVDWTLELVAKKYNSYLQGYKMEAGIKKPINAYVICENSTPVGYIQAYNAYDFSRSKPLVGLPLKLAAFDIFLGEKSSLRRGFGAKAMIQFFKQYLGNSYTHIFADPQSNNIAAIRAYEKVGFMKISEQADVGEIWMLKMIKLTSNT